MLTGITLTGADESIKPEILANLSAEFPFVEWGILIGTRRSVPRWPGMAWIENLVKRSNIKLSLHLCGKALRDVLNDYPFEWESPIEKEHFNRVQLNFHGQPISESQKQNLLDAAQNWPFKETIVQLDGENDDVLDSLLSKNIRASGLYDVSHGSGKVPDKWPKPNSRWKVGYAGGLGPDNVLQELEHIFKAAEDQNFWIDMETKLRSNGGSKFDEDLSHDVLVSASRFF